MLTYADVCYVAHRLRVHPGQRPEAVRAADAPLRADGDGYGRPQVLTLLALLAVLSLLASALSEQMVMAMGGRRYSVYLLYGYKGTNTDAEDAAILLYWYTSTNTDAECVSILLSWYTSTNTDAECDGRPHAAARSTT